MARKKLLKRYRVGFSVGFGDEIGKLDSTKIRKRFTPKSAQRKLKKKYPDINLFTYTFRNFYK